MIKKIVMVSVVVWLPILSMGAFAEEYFSVGGGRGGKADASNLTFERGTVSTDRKSNHFFAMGFSSRTEADDA